MRENPRPTRHLEQLETAQLGKLAPGSVSGPAWDLVALPVPPDGGVPDASDVDVVAHRFAPAQPAPPQPVPPAVLAAPVPPPVPAASAAAPAESITSPSARGAGVRRLTMVAVGCGVLAAFALGIGGLSMLWADRPDTETTGPVERTALDLPLVPADDTHDGSTGEPAEPRLRDGDDAEAGEPREDGADADLLGDGTASSGGGLDQGGTGEGAPGTGAGTGTSTGGSGGSGSGSGSGSGAGSGAGGGTGPGGGGTTPTDGPPPPTSDPTTDPTEEPTPKPTPTASEDPTPEPTPSPSVSPTPTPTGAPVSPNAGG